MTPPTALNLIESKSKDLVPQLGGRPLHSLHNPIREAEVFASNHLAHLSRSSSVLVLGLGFGYHIEEIIKILHLKHKTASVAVLEPRADLIRLWESYRASTGNITVFNAKDVPQIYANKAFCEFLLQKPVVIIHPQSFEASPEFYRSFMSRRAAADLSAWQVGDPWWDTWVHTQEGRPWDHLASSAPQAAWLNAFWELKHAE
jgi:hypothetical protein